MKRFLAVLLSLVMVLGIFTGCGKNDSTAENYIYYIGSDKLSIVPEEYEFESDNTMAMVSEAVKALSTETGEVDYIRTIPQNVVVNSLDLDVKDLSIDFSRNYLDLDVYTEILIRAAIVKTLSQISGIDSITFYVAGAPLTDTKGNTIGPMTKDYFVDNFATETKSLLNANIKLYFASADGATLVAEDRNIYYSSNVTIEKIALDNLLKGPEESSLLATLPSGSKAINVITLDGTCYVNMDSTFTTTMSTITENITVYSVVNTLCQFDHISKVQLLVDGVPIETFGTMTITGPLVASESLVNKENYDLLKEEKTLE